VRVIDLYCHYRYENCVRTFSRKTTKEQTISFMGRTCEDNIKVGHKETECNGVDYIQPVQDIV
jgi:hypothetical protein